MPSAPDLIDPRLGDDAFALSYVSELVQPHTVMPPADLPPLLLEEVWRVDGGCGAGAGQLNAPHGVALDASAGRVYVADTGNRRILAYDLVSGAPAGVYGEGAFEEAADLAAGPAGELIALDAVAQQLVRIDTATGELAPLTLDTSFYRPRGLAVDEAGRILVADTGGGRVVLLDSTGQTLVQFGGVDTALGRGQPVDALVAGGSLWAVTAEDGRLWRLDDLAGITAIPLNTVDGPHLIGLSDARSYLTDPAAGAVRYHGQAATAAPVRLSGPLRQPRRRRRRNPATWFTWPSDSATCTLSVWRSRRGSAALDGLLPQIARIVTKGAKLCLVFALRQIGVIRGGIVHCGSQSPVFDAAANAGCILKLQREPAPYTQIAVVHRPLRCVSLDSPMPTKR